MTHVFSIFFSTHLWSFIRKLTGCREHDSNGACNSIGYPVVTLGFGFKSYVSYRMRLRRQKEVARENEFYIELLHQALPKEALAPVAAPAVPLPPPAPSLSLAEGLATTNGSAALIPNGHHQNGSVTHLRKPLSSSSPSAISSSSPLSNNSHHTNHNHHTPSNNGHESNGRLSMSPLKLITAMDSSYDSMKPKNGHHNEVKIANLNSFDKHELQYMEHWTPKNNKNNHNSSSSVNDYNEEDEPDSENMMDTIQNHKTSSFKNALMSAFSFSTSSSTPKQSHSRESSTASQSSSTNQASSNNPQTPPVSKVNNHHQVNGINGGGDTRSLLASLTPSLCSGKKQPNKNASSPLVNSSAASCSPSETKSSSATSVNSLKDDYVLRLEAEIKKMKQDLHASRQTEQELRSQINTLSIEDRDVRAEISQLMLDNENLQTKLHNLVTARQQDKQKLTVLETKVLEEKKMKASLETQLSSERKAKKEGEAATTRALVNTMSHDDDLSDIYLIYFWSDR